MRSQTALLLCAAALLITVHAFDINDPNAPIDAPVEGAGVVVDEPYIVNDVDPIDGSQSSSVTATAAASGSTTSGLSISNGGAGGGSSAAGASVAVSDNAAAADVSSSGTANGAARDSAGSVTVGLMVGGILFAVVVVVGGFVVLHWLAARHRPTLLATTEGRASEDDAMTNLATMSEVRLRDTVPCRGAAHRRCLCLGHELLLARAMS